MKPIATPRVPGAVGPYSRATAAGNLLFVSGQLPINPSTGSFPSDDPVEQPHRCLRNIAAIAQAAGTDLAHTVKTTVLLRALDTFADVNAAYAAFFPEPCPVRSTFEVSGLPKGARVEIEAVIALEG